MKFALTLLVLAACGGDLPAPGGDREQANVVDAPRDASPGDALALRPVPDADLPDAVPDGGVLGVGDAAGLSPDAALPCDGTCAPGTVCGDNGHVGMCGHFCSAEGWEAACASLPNVPAAGAWRFGCTAPYRLNVPGHVGEPVYRPGGTEGCLVRQPPGFAFALLCCPS